MSPQHLAIYLINIDRAADRLAEMRRQSAEFSIELNRVEGVDGQVHPSEDWIDVDVRLFLKRNGRHILPGNMVAIAAICLRSSGSLPAVETRRSSLKTTSCSTIRF